MSLARVQTPTGAICKFGSDVADGERTLRRPLFGLETPAIRQNDANTGPVGRTHVESRIDGVVHLRGQSSGLLRGRPIFLEMSEAYVALGQRERDAEGDA